MNQSFDVNRWKRFDDWDARTLRLGKFVVEDPENGFSAFKVAADPGTAPNEIVVGVSPGFGSKIFRTLAGHRLSVVLRALKSGIVCG